MVAQFLIKHVCFRKCNVSLVLEILIELLFIALNPIVKPLDSLVSLVIDLIVSPYPRHFLSILYFISPHSWVGGVRCSVLDLHLVVFHSHVNGQGGMNFWRRTDPCILVPSCREWRGFSKVFGWAEEITRRHRSLMPASWVGVLSEDIKRILKVILQCLREHIRLNRNRIIETHFQTYLLRPIRLTLAYLRVYLSQWS